MPASLDPSQRRAKLQNISGIYPLADDDSRWAHGAEDIVAAAVTAGALVVQLRLKQTRDRDALELARRCRRLCDSHRVLLFVNDRFDLAYLADADGVHLGTDDCPPEAVPPEIRERLLIGLSTHTLEQVQAAAERPVDYIGFGPVFGTRSKQSEYESRGVDRLEQAVRKSAHPVVAIGGIGLEQAARVARAGAVAAAVISAISDAPDAEAATRELRAAFASGSSQAER